MTPPSRRVWTDRLLGPLTLIVPGLMVAATGVGAGDLISASLAGSDAGVGVLWLAVVGAAMKLVLNEGVARWQMATGTSLLRGLVASLGPWAVWPFLIYFAAWAALVAGSLASACGVAATAFVELTPGDPNASRILWGLVHAAVGWGIVRVGGLAVFESVMGLSVAVMVVTVLVCVLGLGPDPQALWNANVPPRLPAAGLDRALAVLGGVGGTVTLLSYGYWVRDHGRQGQDGLRICRIDLTICYLLTAAFGMGMILIGSRIEVEGQGARLATQLADQLGATLGPIGRVLFLAGFWAAVFSSLLGVWQSAPYLLADLWRGRRRIQTDWARARVGSLTPSHEEEPDLTSDPAYRWGLAVLAWLPAATLFVTSVKTIQYAYAALGSLFLPGLAAALLVLNGSPRLGTAYRNGWLTTPLLIMILLVYLGILIRGISLN
ncbi:Mn2+ and Fe2+ transporter of the NRAMP family-like protein [Isosphaera pallida ATCC 43644]|uniref:Mn2+ and Fe2+ transporter of the NRAMP family-like protein n=1 Tax=Isosphaera pallida (strain ATCC 43644 / DSM 9630 / IS1B) TaxID=575540 RepID=E8QWY4_ISOPI|nr:Nramp family divalent metal transporter [Isosphaera pallida]ADV64023.1 Mn2+ and Fe2+ transporter of the NRAMP family-like protein [Isosphaera pallida ATCC 43644]